MSNASRLAAPLGMVGVAFLLLAMGIARSPATGTDGPAYTVAGLDALLAGHPAAWLNRILRVRARPEACLVGMDGPGSPCRERHPVLIDADPWQHAEALPLVRGRASPLLDALRRLPRLGRLLPAPQAVRWGVVGMYRVRLRAIPADSCAAPPCYQALLLDGSP